MMNMDGTIQFHSVRGVNARVILELDGGSCLWCGASTRSLDISMYLGCRLWWLLLLVVLLYITIYLFQKSLPQWFPK